MFSPQRTTAPDNAKQRFTTMSQAQRKIQVVTTEKMMNDKLFRAMHFAPKSKIAQIAELLQQVSQERTEFEAHRERKLSDGSVIVGQSNDIKHVHNLAASDAVARLLYALKVDVRAYLYPQSCEGGKTSSQTSNLKAYKKTLEIAETIFHGTSSLENVVKVFTVCAYRATVNFGQEVIKRDYSESFLNSYEFRSISQGTAELWNAIDDVRAKHMSTGAATQASQMIRTLVALKSAVDVQDGRSKNTAIDPQGLVINALMSRFGQIDAVNNNDGAHDAPVTVESASTAPEGDDSADDVNALCDAPSVAGDISDSVEQSDTSVDDLLTELV
jgi:hypothetical protein